MEPIGIYNPKNQCYFNSLIQMIMTCKSIFPAIDSVDNRGTGRLFVHMNKYLVNGNKKLFGKACVLLKEKYIHDQKQWDAQEVLMVVLGGLHRGSIYMAQMPGMRSHWANSLIRDYVMENHRFFYPDKYSVVDEFFGGHYMNLVSCCVCGYQSPSIQSIVGLQVPIESHVNLESALDCYFAGEKLIDYSCPICNKKTTAMRKTYLVSLPEYIPLVLGRFTKDWNRNIYLKDNSFIGYEEVTDFGKYFLTSSKKPKLYMPYEVIAVLNHLGGLETGHYYSFAKHNQKWWAIDDTRVHRMNRMPTRRSAYVLMFRRKTGKSPAFKSSETKYWSPRYVDTPSPVSKKTLRILEGENEEGYIESDYDPNEEIDEPNINALMKNIKKLYGDRKERESKQRDRSRDAYKNKDLSDETNERLAIQRDEIRALILSDRNKQHELSYDPSKHKNLLSDLTDKELEDKRNTIRALLSRNERR